MAKRNFMLKNFKISCILVLIAITSFQSSEGAKIRIQIDGNKPIFTTDTKNPSFAMGFGIFKYQWTKYFNNPKFLTLIRALGPSYLRVGGTRADYARFVHDAEQSLLRNKREVIERFNKRDQNGQCIGVIPDPVEFEKHRIETLEKEALFYQQKKNGGPITDLNVNYTGQQFDELMTLVKCSGWNLIFNLNFLTARMGKNWDPTNAIQLMKYSQTKQYLFDWELGNEPNSYLHRTGSTFSAKALSEGFASLKSSLNKYPYWKKSKIFGPDISGFFRESSRKMMKKFVNYSSVVVNATTFHQYYINSVNATTKNFTDPKILNKLLPQVEDAVSIARSRKLPAWLGETSSSYGGGAKGLSDTYVAGFMWLDKLGMCAANGIDLVIRQTIIQGNYALLDDDFEPRPDYWLTLLYKRLIDSRVLNVTMFNQDEKIKKKRGRVRVYAHCTNIKRIQYQPGSVTLYYLNLEKKRKTLLLSDSQGQNSSVDVYILTPSRNFLNSSGVNLNGNTIRMQSIYNLPPLLPRQLDLSSSQQIRLPALSIGFIVLKSARVEACLHNSSRQSVFIPK